MPERTLTEVHSGLFYQSADTQALQNDNFANPGLLWVDRGLTLWSDDSAPGVPSCAECHGNISQMRGVATRYPTFAAEKNRLLNLTQQIQECRVTRQHHDPLPYESEILLALTTAVVHQSKGLPFDVTLDKQTYPYWVAGKNYFYERRGQMNLACNHCHEHYAGRMLRGDRLSQGHGNGYPAYRLQWQGVGSLHRRLRFCNQGIRAEPFDYGAAEYVSLELFLAWRATDLVVETPAVRR